MPALGKRKQMTRRENVHTYLKGKSERINTDIKLFYKYITFLDRAYYLNFILYIIRFKGYK